MPVGILDECTLDLLQVSLLGSQDISLFKHKARRSTWIGD